MTEINQRELYFLEKASEANYGLWNALLTVNGILVSAFSLIISLAPLANRRLIKTLIVFCAISIILILWNYLTTKRHYIATGRQITMGLVLSNEQKQADINKSIRRSKLILYREFIALLLLFLEIVIVIFIVICF